MKFSIKDFIFCAVLAERFREQNWMIQKKNIKKYIKIRQN